MPKGLARKNIGVLFVVLVIGSVINALLAVFLLAIPLMLTHEIIVEKVLVRNTVSDLPAALAGIRAGDQIQRENTWIRERRLRRAGRSFQL